MSRIPFACAIALLPAVLVAELTFSVRPDRPHALYACGETATFAVTALDGGATATGGVVNAVLDNAGTQQVASVRVDLAAGNPFRVSGTLAGPGFLRLTLAGPNVRRTVRSVAFEPERIRRGGPRPADFDAWWEAQVAKLEREVPLDPRVERADDASTPAYDMYRISFATFGRRVYGWMSVPTDRAKAPYPVRFSVPGAGWGDYSNRAKGLPDAIRVVMSVYPFPPAGKDWKTPEARALYDGMNAEAEAAWGTMYSQSGLAASREAYFFYPVILGINRVVDWVAARPDANLADFTYNGYSQGGGFGFYLAGLNRHFTRAVMHVPALTDILGLQAGRVSGWPTPIERQRPENRAAAARHAPYFDAANFASRIRIPVRVAVGFADETCPPSAVYAAYNEIASSDKDIVHGNAMGHAVGAYRALHQRIDDWVVEPPVCPVRPFAPGSRVTFFGDSITAHNYFYTQLEFVGMLCRPDCPFVAISRGHAGDTASGGVGRWDWDAAPEPSDRAVVMFGMNDVRRSLWRDELPDAETAAQRRQALDAYAASLRALADKILAGGRALTLVTPSPFDQYAPGEPPANIPFCNDPGLAACARIVRDLAREKGLDVIDYHGPLTKVLREHPAFGMLAHDRVHPGRKGGLLMAVLALEQAGDLPPGAVASFDAHGAGEAAFAYAPASLPYPRTEDYAAVNAIHPLDGRLLAETVRIANLPDGRYELTGDGAPVGVFSAAELAAGVDLSGLGTPSARQAMAAAGAYAAYRGHLQKSRRLVAFDAVLRRMNVDPADAQALEKAVATHRASIERRYGGGRNPGMCKYAHGQVDFYLEHHRHREAFAAENARLRQALAEACRPRGWQLAVRPANRKEQ